jgi:hypothetical protein
VAVAAGSYVESLIIKKPVRLWGVCPSQTELFGTSSDGALWIYGSASGTEVHGLAVRGSSRGIIATGADPVLLEHLWIHDTGDVGVLAQEFSGPANVTLAGSLVERAAFAGVSALGAIASLEDCVVRDTAEDSSGVATGVLFSYDPETNTRSVGVIRSSVVENNRAFGVYVQGSDGSLEASVVRDTPSDSAGAFGNGISAQSDPSGAARARLEVRQSIVERVHNIGIYVAGGADATVETTVVRDVLASASGKNGDGVFALDNTETKERATLAIQWSLIERTQDAGLLVIGGDVTADAVAIRDIQPFAETGQYGRGLGIQYDALTGEKASGTVTNAAIDRCFDIGVFIAGAEVTIENTAVRDTLPEAARAIGGRGIVLQEGLLGEAAKATLRRSVVERSHDAGFIVVGASLEVAGLRVLDTAVRASDGAFGDGVAILSGLNAASAKLSDVLVARSARAGISSFGASVALERITLECNPISLDGESYGGHDYAFEDLGDHSCGCDGIAEECTVLSSSLAPPTASPTH